MLKWLRRHVWLLAPFFMSVSVLLAVYAKYGVYPFGGKVAFFWDGSTQVFPFLGAFRQAVLSGKDIQYTLNALFGMDPVALYAYYLASPFNLVALLFPIANLPEAYLAIILLKTGISAVAFAVYARSCLKCGRLTAVLFSQGYALMGWLIFNAYFIMWLDALIWLPLICMGIHRLLERGRPAMLTLCYAALFWSNYYVGFMVAAFSALYCAVWIALHIGRGSVRTYLLRGMMQIASGLLALGMVACLIVPAFLLMQDSKAIAGDVFPRLGFTAMDMEAPLSSLLPLVQAVLSGVNTNQHDLKLFHGTLPLALAIGFFFHRGIPTRKRAVIGGGLLLLFYSLQNNWLNRIWHLTNDPTGYIFRQTFLVSFACLALGAVMFESLARREAHAKRAALRGSLVLLFALLLINGLAGKTVIPFWQYSVNLALVVAGAALVQMWAAGAAQKRARSTIAVCLLLLMSMDAYNNANQVLFTFPLDSRAEHEDRAGAREIVDAIARKDPALYRLGDASEAIESENDGMLYGYPSGAIYSSTANLQALNLANTMGFRLRGWATARTDYASNLITDALFGFRYILNGPQNNPGYATGQTEGGGVYQRNPHALPYLFAAPGSFDGIPEVTKFIAQDAVWYSFDIDVPAIQQALLQRVAPDAQCFAILTPDIASEGSAKYTCVTDGLVYVYRPWTTGRGFSVHWNGVPVETYAPIGFAHAGDRIEILLEDPLEGPENPAAFTDAPPTSAAAWQVAQIDQQAFAELMTGIQAKTHSVKRLSDASFSAEVTVSPGDRLFITLPYSSGWSLRANGRPVPLENALQAFMGAELEPGEHSLLLTYTRPGQRLGLAISGACWLAFGLYLLLSAHIRKNRRKAAALI